MSPAAHVEDAFLELERAPERARTLLRRVLLVAMRDPRVLRLATGALSEHLTLLGQCLEHLPADTLAEVPEAAELVRARSLDDARATGTARSFLDTLEARHRRRVVWAVNHAPAELLDALGGRFQLELFVRLMAIALADPAFTAHVLRGGAIESFLPRGVARSKRIASGASRSKPRVARQRRG